MKKKTPAMMGKKGKKPAKNPNFKSDEGGRPERASGERMKAWGEMPFSEKMPGKKKKAIKGKNPKKK